jgi:hypothetical protein
VAWESIAAKCLKTINPSFHPFGFLFEDTWLCPSSAKTACSTPYGKHRTIALQVQPGEVITAAVDMQDYDALSANDTVCKGFTTLGPFTAAELQSGAYRGKVGTIHMSFNGHAECTVTSQLL